MNKAAKIVIIACTVVLLCIVSWVVTPIGRAFWNSHFYAVQKVDDATSYKTKKQVEDTCRSMIASYSADKLTYDQYKDSDSTEKQSWAEQAKMRANKTASTYNNYILQNSFVWGGNIPADISEELPYIG